MSKEQFDDDDVRLNESETEYDEARRGLMDSILPKVVKKVLVQGIEALGDEKIGETLVADVVRKAIHKGNEVVDVTEDSVRRLVGELPLAKEVADKLTSRLDDYRSDLVRVITDEMRGFFDRIDIGTEIQKALTSMSLEISTEIKFVPADTTTNHRTSIEPKVSSKTRVKRANRPKKKTSSPPK